MNERPTRCYLPEYKGGGPKKRYATAGEAWLVWRKAIAARPLMEVYACDECTYFHLGNRRLTAIEWEAEQARRAARRAWLGPSE